MIQAVFFDVGNTLIYPSPGVAETFAGVALQRGHTVEVSDVERYMPEMTSFYEAEYARDGDFWCSHEGSTAIWLDQYRYLCHLLGIEHDAEAMAASVHACYRGAQHWALFQDVIPCLRELKQRGLALGVISNWDAALEDLLRDLHLLPYFDCVISSAVVGYRKPNTVIFDLACEQLGVEFSLAAHVGDHPSADGQGARNAGLLPLIIDRHQTEIRDGFKRVHSLASIPELL